MKWTVLFAILATLQAGAYSSNPIKVKTGALNHVGTFGTSWAGQKELSIQVDMIKKTSAAPVVQIASQSQNSCAHKKTLITYSGYDLAKQTYLITYEVQIVRQKLNKQCLVIIQSDENESPELATRVSII